MGWLDWWGPSTNILPLSVHVLFISSVLEDHVEDAIGHRLGGDQDSVSACSRWSNLHIVVLCMYMYTKKDVNTALFSQLVKPCHVVFSIVRNDAVFVLKY